jgi:hypothetical protein
MAGMKSLNNATLLRNALLAGMFLATCDLSRATNYTWQGGTANWDSTSAWSPPGTYPGQSFSLTTTDSITINGTGSTSATINWGSTGGGRYTYGITITGGESGSTTFEQPSGSFNRNLFIGADGITINSGAGAVTIGSTTTNLGINAQLTSSQTWTNNSSNVFTIDNLVADQQAYTTPVGTPASTTPVLLTLGGSGNFMFGGVIADSGGTGGALSLAVSTSGTVTLTGSSTYTGTTTVSTGALFLNNTSGSGSGTGSLTVSGAATLGGTGSYGTTGTLGAGFKITGTGTATGSRATVLVGMGSASDTNTTKTLGLIASTGSISNANLQFNISATHVGALGSDPGGSGTELSVRNTNVTFDTSVASVQLTLNVQNEPGIIAANTPYVLIAGTGSTSNTGGISGGQYTGLSLGAATTLAAGVTETRITGSNLQVMFANSLDQQYYGANSYLVLYQDSTNHIDDIEVIVVPEPTTWAMIFGGFGLLLLIQRRKGRNDRP